jgi:hypothetical protein
MTAPAKTKLPTPEVTARSWTYRYKRPRQLGWPLLLRTGWEQGNRPAARITPKMITVVVRQAPGAEDSYPRAASVHCRGSWPSGREYAGQLLMGVPPGQALQIYAPDWVLDLVADAERRAAEEAGEG